MRWLHDVPDEAWDVVRRDFDLADLQQALGAVGVARAILVQATTTVAETTELLRLAASRELVAGVVGWVPLADAEETSKALAAVTGPKLVGIRHLVGWPVEGDLFAPGTSPRPSLERLAAAGLVLEFMPAAIHNLDWLVDVARELPSLRLVIDHLAKPVGGPTWSEWDERITALSRFSSVYMKVSGWTTPVRPAWSGEELRPYAERAVELFGAERLMFGSNWPVTIVAGSYRRVYEETLDALDACSQAELDLILGLTAAHVYRLDSPHRLDPPRTL